jgi:hypothetical protein
MTVAIGRQQRNRDNKKLTKVLSTKLSIGDYNRFVIYSKTAHAQGIIDEPTPSRFLRYIASDLIEGVLDKITPPSSGPISRGTEFLIIEITGLDPVSYQCFQSG